MKNYILIHMCVRITFQQLIPIWFCNLHLTSTTFLVEEIYLKNFFISYIIKTFCFFYVFNNDYLINHYCFCTFQKFSWSLCKISTLKQKFMKATTIHCNENPIYVFPEKELRGLSSNFHIHVPVNIYIFPEPVHIFSCSRLGRPILRIYESLTDIWMWK